jgi:hypothetical protein
VRRSRPYTGQDPYTGCRQLELPEGRGLRRGGAVRCRGRRSLASVSANPTVASIMPATVRRTSSARQRMGRSGARAIRCRRARSGPKYLGPIGALRALGRAHAIVGEATRRMGERTALDSSRRRACPATHSHMVPSHEAARGIDLQSGTRMRRAWRWLHRAMDSTRGAVGGADAPLGDDR